MTATLVRSVGVWGGVAIMMGIMIGSGIYRTPTTIAAQLDQPWLILLLWSVGAVVALCGALVYAELGTMFPRAGGLYVFLHEGLGRPVAFTFGWCYLIITQPLATAGIVTVFAEHVALMAGQSQSPWFVPAVTISTILALTAINVTGIRRGAWMAVVLTGAKTMALAGIIVLALILGGGAGTAAPSAPSPTAGSLWGAIIPVMMAILWTYDGWSDAAAVAEEIREPQRRLPLMFLGGTAVVAVLYLAANAVYMWMIPLEEMARTETVAPLVMERLVGGAGRHVVTALILVSTLGAAHASLICGARVSFGQARDGLLFRPIAHVHRRFGTPDVALWIQGLLGCVMVLVLGRFEALINSFVFTSWIFYGLAGASLFLLRHRRPDAERPYRCAGYPLVPGLFVLAAVGMTIGSIVDSPGSTLPWVGVLACGAPLYLLWNRGRRPVGGA